MEVLLGAATTLRCWFAKLGSDEALILQPLQGGIHAANSDIPPGALLKLFTNRNTLGILTKADEYEDHHQFTVAQLIALGHLL
jgi:hypothetical protein